MKKLLIGMLALVACGSDNRVPAAGETARVCGKNLEHRAYIVSRDSEDLTVLDLDCLEITGSAKIGTQSAHMAEVGRGLDELFVTSSGTDEIVVVDTRDLSVKTRMPVPVDPTHLSMFPSGNLMAVMVEGKDAVAFIDAASKTTVKVLEGFFTPHFIRFSPDGRTGYVANLGASHITRVDLAKLEIEGQVSVDEGDSATSVTRVADEGGFADAQIDERGILYAAHAATGRVVAFDTNTKTRLPNLVVGDRPWVVFAEHHFPGQALRHVVPNFGSETLSFIDGVAHKVTGNGVGDREAYGVNYSPLAPNKAFVMNRVRQDIAVVNTESRDVEERIEVGGNTETASTSADGKYIVATVSSANRVVVIDVATRKIVKRFENVGKYPWSVVIPGGQNYCH